MAGKKSLIRSRNLISFSLRCTLHGRDARATGNGKSRSKKFFKEPNMIYATTSKDVVSIFPQARLNNSSFTVTSVDRRNFDYATLEVSLGATDVGLTTFKLQESDDNSTWTDVPNGDFSISGTLPSSANSDTLWSWDIDLTGRKRYLRPAITVGNGSSGAFLTAKFKLSRAEETPYNAATRNLAGVLTL
jgi:hypothetical protein